MASKTYRHRWTISPAVLKSGVLALLLYTLSCVMSPYTSFATEQDLVFAAKQKCEAGEYFKAIRLLEAQNRKHPDNPEIHYLLGVCQLKAQRLSQAHKAFSTTLELEKRYQTAIGEEYYQAGLEQLKKGSVRKSRILLQKSSKYDPVFKEKIAREAFSEGKRLFDRGEYDDADERFSVASSFESGYSEKICDMYFHLGNSLDSKSCLYFYGIARWYCSDHNEEIGLRLVQIAKNTSDEERREEYKSEAAKYIGEEAVRSVLPAPSWRTIHASIYTGKGYDEKNSPEYHIRTIQYGKDVHSSDRVVVETEGPFRVWDAGWQDWQSRCIIPPKERSAGEYVYLEGKKDKKMTVRVERYQ